MQRWLRQGQRVRDEFLGQGTVVEVMQYFAAALVLFDERPPLEYNLGGNPCLRFAATLTPVEEEQG